MSNANRLRLRVAAAAVASGALAVGGFALAATAGASNAGHPNVSSFSSDAQGPVQYMLMDFVADGHGTIDHETRTVTGVTTPMPATGWYLNLHQGNSNNILANGQPTIFFRPLLCANI